MNRMRTSAVLAAGVVASAVLVGGPVAAQDDGPTPELTVNPTSGPIGTTIDVSGTECFGTDVWFLLGNNADGYVVTDGDSVPDAEGAWGGQLEVPATYANEDGVDVAVVPGTNYVVTAQCLTDGEVKDVLYEEIPFEVTGTTPPTTPPTTAPPVTTAPPATTPTTTAPVTTTPPAAAQPVTQAPAYRG